MKVSALSVLILSIFMLLACSSEKGMTVYLVRHAEKDLQDTTQNPSLTPDGLARSQRLRDLLANEPVTAIYSTGFDRNLNTVKPLADAKNLDIETYEWHDWRPMIRKIKRSEPGQNLVICGHGDNLLPMIDDLGGIRPVESLGDYEYDKIFKVEIRPDTTLVSVIIY